MSIYKLVFRMLIKLLTQRIEEKLGEAEKEQRRNTAKYNIILPNILKHNKQLLAKIFASKYTVAASYNTCQLKQLDKIQIIVQQVVAH